jgi:putative Ca2+/H+ antiporter (TMEM165/GDT1 family)
VNGFDAAAAATTFLLILPAELPDKTFIATLVLASRFPHRPVWIGVSLAFLVQCVVAVVAGGLLSLLPARLVSGAAAVLFAFGAVLMLRGALSSRREARAELQAAEDEEAAVIDRRIGTADPTAPLSSLRVAATSFTVLFVAEWGDLSQLLTAAQAARTGEPFSVLVGAWLALVLVAAAAVALGGWLSRKVDLHRVRFVSAGVLAVLALIATIEAIRA